MLKLKLKFCRVRAVKPPHRAHPGDAGLDFFAPEDFNETWLKPHEAVLIPSGIKVEVPLGWALVFHNKSGVASKKRLTVLACVVDHGYKGEVHLSLVNVGESPQLLRPGDKLVQGLLLPVGLAAPEEVPEDELWHEVLGTRGEDGFGSTGI